MTPEIRISDADREAAVTALGEHYASGRLTKDEYDERATQAYAARTASALRPLFADLPGPHPPTTGRPTAQRTHRTSYQRTPQVATPPRRGFRVPVLPLLLVLIGVAIVASAPWLVFVGLGLMWFARGGCRRRYASGRDRAPRGSWA